MKSDGRLGGSYPSLRRLRRSRAARQGWSSPKELAGMPNWWRGGNDDGHVVGETCTTTGLCNATDRMWRRRLAVVLRNHWVVQGKGH
ncbi:MAG: hypothetical protein IKR81_08340 [Victivallales bacterium]|nr:hypothetical protein [Victivallales bacterium]